MGRLKDLIHGEPVHERRLELRTYPLEGDRIVVEGWLKDDRRIEGYHWDGRPRPEGTVHWMCVRLLIEGWPLTILEAEAEMSQVPHELCPTTLDAVQRLVGLSVVSGFSAEVVRRLGGVKGCTHMTHLIVAMGPAALHGYWTWRSRKRRPLPRSMAEMAGLEALINSCYLWREGGPLMQAVKDTIEAGADEH